MRKITTNDLRIHYSVYHNANDLYGAKCAVYFIAERGLFIRTDL